MTSKYETLSSYQTYYNYVQIGFWTEKLHRHSCSLIWVNFKGNFCADFTQTDDIDRLMMTKTWIALWDNEATEFEEPSEGVMASALQITDFEEPSGPATVKRPLLWNCDNNLYFSVLSL